MFILAHKQENLIYPGMKRPIHILQEPFENIHHSFYKKGTTGKIWIYFGGNNNNPIDYHDIFKNISIEHSILLITYPGYNGFKQDMNPHNTNLTIKKCINSILNKGYNIKDINFICYSIGCAIAINYLATHNININNLVLLAPFWSLDEIVHSKYPYPISIIKFLMNHNWENYKLKDIHPNINTTIIHGKNDELIHYSHSDRLSKLRNIELIYTNDDHRSIREIIPNIINKN